MVPTQPKFFDMPFAYNGGRNTIPASGDEEDGNATLDQGFPIITEQPLSQGGLPPRRKDFNGILYALSNFCFFAQSGGVFTYDTTLNYRSPALVWYNNNFWICIKANGPDSTVVTPGTDSSYWQDFVEFLDIDTSVAQRLGTSDVGSGTKHIYLDSGSPKASGSTVGGTAQGMWLNAGTMTAMSATIGSSTTPAWCDGGVWKACSREIPESGTSGDVVNYVIKSYTYTRISSTEFTIDYTTANGDFAMPSGNKVVLVGSDSNMGDTSISTRDFSEAGTITITIRIDGKSAGSQTLRSGGSGRATLTLNGEMYIAYFNSYPYFHFPPATQTEYSGSTGE